MLVFGSVLVVATASLAPSDQQTKGNLTYYTFPPIQERQITEVVFKVESDDTNSVNILAYNGTHILVNLDSNDKKSSTVTLKEYDENIIKKEENLWKGLYWLDANTKYHLGQFSTSFEPVAIAYRLDTTILTRDTFVVQYYAAGSFYHRLKIYNTSGAVLYEFNASNNVDNTVSLDSARINETQFVSVAYQRSDNWLAWYVFDTTGVMLINGSTPTGHDTLGRQSACVAVRNETSGVMGWFDRTDTASFRLTNFNPRTGELGTNYSFDANMNPTSSSAEYIDCTYLNESTLVVGNNYQKQWVGNTRTITHSLDDSNTFEELQYNTTNGEMDQTDVFEVATTNNGTIMVLWSDSRDILGSNDQGLYISTFDSQLSPVIERKQIFPNASGNVDGKIRLLHSGDFLWTYSWNATQQLWGIIDVDGEVVKSVSYYADNMPDVSPSRMGASGVEFGNSGFCNDTGGHFVTAYMDNSRNGFWEVYYDNGTVWDGICPEVTVEDTTPPTFVFQPYNSTTTNVSAIISWTMDESTNYTLRYTTNSDYSGGTLISNNTFGTSRTHFIGGLTNSTWYYINVSAWDTSGNFNTSNTSFITAQNVVGAAVTVCDCPSSGDWDINDGTICEITTECNIGTNSIHITSGGLRILNGGGVIADGCYTADNQILYTDDGGYLNCGS